MVRRILCVVGFALFSSLVQAQTVSTSVSTLPTSPVVVTFTGGKTTTDWVGVMKSGVTPLKDEDLVDWFYLNGTKTTPKAIVVSGAVTFPAIPAVGPYVVRAYTKNTFTATSTFSFQVEVPLPVPEVVTPITRLGWSQPADTLQDAIGYIYKLYEGKLLINILDPTCDGTMSPFTCSALIPKVLSGLHSVTITASNEYGESDPGAPFAFKMVAVPLSPSNVIGLP